MVAGYDTPSVRERNLAKELRTLRRAAQLQGKDVAGRLGWSASKVSRIENGRIGIGVEDLELLIALYAVPYERATFLRRLADSIRAKGWWDAYRETLNPGYGSLIKLEAGSSALRSYCVLVPHALLMTRDFARQIILLAPQSPSASELEHRLEVVRRRQEVLQARGDREPLQLSVILDESFLHRRVVSPEGDEAGRALMRQQLERLLADAERPNVTLRLLPLTVGLPPVTVGSFSILGSTATGSPDVVYMENKSRIFFIDAESEVNSYVQDFELIASWALTPAASADRIRRRVADLDS